MTATGHVTESRSPALWGCNYGFLISLVKCPPSPPRKRGQLLGLEFYLVSTQGCPFSAWWAFAPLFATTVLSFSRHFMRTITVSEFPRADMTALQFLGCFLDWYGLDHRRVPHVNQLSLSQVCVLWPWHPVRDGHMYVFRSSVHRIVHFLPSHT